MSARLIFGGVVALAVVTIIGLGYVHYNGLVDERDRLRTERAQLETAVRLQDQTLDAQAEALEEWQEAHRGLLARFEEMQRVADEAHAETRRLHALFSQHDLADLAARRPGLIERRINAGTTRIGRMLECASGAPGPDCPD
ncbi:hypothetical protein ELZ19_07030 [Brucella abortus]|uniref:hypothetical protein n=1 Tax=Brucella abortus TaxID=235 RepID=UPI0004E8EAF3|nr:hypothetical protein [Brucella abortus]KFH18443.1 hypothetical protein IB60_17205 [Brucella abortus LMN1]RUQ67324.1 hypothetical protein ELZ23_15460 [Brucella abortus]RUQ78540.1 hypothetical protein ELZ22_17110 [Brucella abortus]RUQ88287.1 hypothetical protein ELZ18_15620 [Brucella abortus]RUQ90316.1 hypothetical protein ELZ20_15615 [Brucella abortus]